MDNNEDESEDVLIDQRRDNDRWKDRHDDGQVTDWTIAYNGERLLWLIQIHF